MVVTRSKSIAALVDSNKTNSLTKTKRGSLGSLTSLTEKNDSLEADGSSAKKTMEMDLDAVSNEGNLRLECDDFGKIFANCAAFLLSLDCSYQKKSLTNGFSTKPAHDYKGEASLGIN